MLQYLQYSFNAHTRCAQRIDDFEDILGTTLSLEEIVPIIIARKIVHRALLCNAQVEVSGDDSTHLLSREKRWSTSRRRSSH